MLAKPTILATALLLGCSGSVMPQNDLSKKPNDPGPPVGYSFDSEFQDVYEFAQGYEQQYDIYSSAQVPAPGRPVITITGLPAGASFNGKILSYTPPCDEPNAQLYANGIGEVYVVVTLQSTLDNTQFIQRDPVLLVHQFDAMPGHTCGDPAWKPANSGGQKP